MTQQNDITRYAEAEENIKRRGRGPVPPDEETADIDELTLAARTGRGKPRAQDEDDSDGTSPEFHNEDPDDDEDGGILDLFFEYRFYIIGVVVALVAAFIISTTLLGGEAPPTKANNPDKAKQAANAPETGQMPALTPRETGIVIQDPEEKDGSYYLTAGKIAWKGELKDTDVGQELTLDGPTSAQFKRAVALPSGAITTGVFGRAETGQPIVHATFHRTESNGEETTTGTYFALDNDVVIVQGTYEDTREGSTVTRVYSERAPGDPDYERYAVKFDSPIGVPIPALVGWTAPDPIADAEAS